MYIQSLLYHPEEKGRGDGEEGATKSLKSITKSRFIMISIIIKLL